MLAHHDARTHCQYARCTPRRRDRGAGKLQHLGLIQYKRGRIDVIDRVGLEKSVCECYQVFKKELDRLVSDIPQGDPQHVLGESIT